MSLLYNKLIESVKTAIYESLFDDIDDIVTDNDNVSTIIDRLRGDYNMQLFEYIDTLIADALKTVRKEIRPALNAEVENNGSNN